MKVAKAEQEEFDKVYNFINIMEALFEGRGFFSNEESWREWDDKDEDKKMLLKIEEEVRETDGEYIDGVDNRLILYEFIKRKWRNANYCGSFGRIVIDCEVLIDNCCDKELDYLEFNKDIREGFEAKEKLAKIPKWKKSVPTNDAFHYILQFTDGEIRTCGGFHKEENGFITEDDGTPYIIKLDDPKLVGWLYVNELKELCQE